MPKNNPILTKVPTTAPEVAPAEMRGELESSLEDVKSREGALNSQELMNKNKVKEIKAKAIQSLFGLLEDFGVDASNLESINLFLSKLRERDPDLASLFEIAFTDLTSDADSVQKEEAVAKQAEFKDAGLMNKFQNLGPEMMQPREQ